MHHPAVDRAYDFLTNFIKPLEPPIKLPGIDTLASRAGVSHVSLLRALQQLKSQGLVSTVNGRGTFYTGGTPLPPPPQSVSPPPAKTCCKWEEVRDTIQRDVLLGRYRQGEQFPEMKVLVERYGACRSTMRKGLASLARSGIIAQTVRGFCVPHLSSNHAANTVVLVAKGERNGHISLPSPRSIDSLRHLELECCNAAHSLAIVAYNRELSSFVETERFPSFPKNLPSRENVLGIIVWTMALMQEDVDLILASVEPLGLPVVVLDEMNYWRDSKTRRRTLTTWFTLGVTPRAGFMVGQYLLSQGHRSIAYVDNPFAGVADTARLHGLNNVLQEAGLSTARLSSDSLPGLNPVDLRRKIAQLKKPLFTELLPDMAVLGGSEHSRTQFLEEPLWGLDAFARQVWEHQIIYALLDLLTANPGLTALVAYNDTIAKICKSYIQSRMGSGLGDLSIIGFDDTVVACENALTSYNFNYPAVARAMLHAVTRRLVPSIARPPLEIDGFVTERGSVRTLKGALTPHSPRKVE